MFDAHNKVVLGDVSHSRRRCPDFESPKIAKIVWKNDITEVETITMQYIEYGDRIHGVSYVRLVN
jgi:hypothetical protein